MKNILIIGANGFTGRRILNDLSVNPIYHVTALPFRYRTIAKPIMQKLKLQMLQQSKR